MLVLWAGSGERVGFHTFTESLVGSDPKLTIKSFKLSLNVN